MELDKRMRARLNSLARSEAGGLSEEAHERIISRISRADFDDRRSERERLKQYYAIAGLSAVAAAVVLGLLLLPNSTQEEAAAKPSSPVIDRKVVDDINNRPLCQSQKVSTAAEFTPGRDGRMELDLGSVAYAVADRESIVEYRATDLCLTEIELISGRVTVEARDLAGGRLTVRTGHLEVAVRGTLFAVERRSSGVSIEVAEGNVKVARDGSQLGTVTAGYTGTVRGDRLDTEALTQELITAMRLLVKLIQPDATSKVDPASESRQAKGQSTVKNAVSEEPQSRAATSMNFEVRAQKLVAQADALRKQGDLVAARRLYRKAGEEVSATAEAAWLRLAKMELTIGRYRDATQTLRQYRSRFRKGKLAVEAEWIGVLIAMNKGDRKAAEEAATALIEIYPESPQAAAARHLLDGGFKNGDRKPDEYPSRR